MDNKRTFKPALTIVASALITWFVASGIGVAQSRSWTTTTGDVRVTCPLTVGGSFEAEKDVEVTRDRPPGLEQVRMTRDEIDPALDQDPPLADLSASQLQGEGAASRRVVPEEIVCDEDLVAAAGKVPAD